MQSIKRATFYFLNKLPAGATFKGPELHREVLNMFPGVCYIATVLRYMREYRKDNKIEIKCIDKRKSLYKKGE